MQEIANRISIQLLTIIQMLKAIFEHDVRWLIRRLNIDKTRALTLIDQK